MALEDYRRKRDFEKTTEPQGEDAEQVGNRFVIHEHHATRLHFDLRLEMEGVLKSWAVPKGPSMNPADKRLAVMVEDHPLYYIDFRGEIAEGNYGAGDVEIWDSGTYAITEGAVDKGKLVFEAFGTKLKGAFHLVRLRTGKDWLLIKGSDEFASTDWRLEQVLPGGSRRERREIKSDAQGLKGGSAVAEAQIAISGNDPMPSVVTPMLATLADKPFSDPHWLFELKWDGYRGLAFIEKDSFRFVSRNNQSLIGRFPQAEAIPGAIDAETAILDGEMVAVTSDGKPSFQLLQNAARGLPHEAQLVYYVFDLLYLNGVDLCKRPLTERKQLLRSIVRQSNFVKYSDHVVEKGEAFFEQVSSSGLEGMVAKRMDSPYLQKRTSLWLKVKAIKQQEFVIGGYTRPRGSRQCFGSLIVGVYEGDQLHFAGQVGGGFDDATLRQVCDMLQPLRTDQNPFVDAPKTNEPATWVRPELVCEAKFAEWTNENYLRQPIFLGMRPDKPPQEVVREQPEAVQAVVEPEKRKSRGRGGVPIEDLLDRKELKGDVGVDVQGIEVLLTNLDKVYWPSEGYTKGDLIRYYYQVRETILPHLANRPLILRRFPNGIESEAFYQHNLEDAPDFVKRVQIEEDGNIVNYVVVDSTASLLYVANLGCIAQNPFSSRFQTRENPDWIVIDLDPQAEVAYHTICEVAMVVKDVLDEVGLRGYAKTSGARGMHIYVPIDPIYTYDQTQNFGRIIATIVVSRVPKVTTIERMTAQRGQGEIYVDFLQNAMGKTMASPYSVRAVPGAGVSTPLTWEEVAEKPDKEQYSMFTVPDRIAKVGDLFRDTLAGGQRLTEPMERLAKLLGR